MKLIRCLVLVVVLLQSVVLAHAISVVPGSEREYDGHAYCLLTASGWLEAEDYAEILGGTLAVINDSAENEWVCHTYSPLLTGHYIWIGLCQAPGAEEPAGGWEWADGTPLGYTNWADTDPNDYSGVEDYAILRSEGITSPGYWWDIQEDGYGQAQGVVEVDGGGLFTATPRFGPVPLQVSFADQSTGNPTSWSWDFGDGATSTQRNPTHEYTEVGRYSVSLSVVTDLGPDSETRERYIAVLFPDVLTTHWAWTQVLSCADANIVRGYDDGLYHPEYPVDRGTMAVYISRGLAGGDSNIPAGPATPSFSDVPSNHWAYKQIEYAVSQNVVKGYTDGTYLPTVTVDRGTMAVYIARAMVAPGGDAAIPGGPATASFPDVPTTFWAYKQVEYCVSEGVVKGYTDGKYHPEYPVTRDQMAVYIARAYDLP
ncbi:MAG: S-layer homology domain-containing protein [Armatimonadota bacterium]